MRVTLFVCACVVHVNTAALLLRTLDCTVSNHLTRHACLGCRQAGPQGGGGAPGRVVPVNGHEACLILLRFVAGVGVCVRHLPGVSDAPRCLKQAGNGTNRCSGVSLGVPGREGRTYLQPFTVGVGSGSEGHSCNTCRPPKREDLPSQRVFGDLG